ncbi:MAG: HEAT repeat domain-containing protein, partial [Planctomycetota bacterium]
MLHIAFLVLILSPSGSAQDRAEELIGKLKSESVRERGEAVERLKALGEAARPALEKAARDADPEVARSARYVLHVIEYRAAIPDVLRKDLPDLEDRFAARGPPAWAEVFKALLGAGNEGSPHWELLNRTLDAIATRTLLAVEAPKLKSEIMLGIRDRELSSAVPAVVEMLRHPDGTVREGAKKALIALRPDEAIDDIIALLQDPDMNVRYNVLDLLHSLKAKRAVPGIAAALKDT